MKLFYLPTVSRKRSSHLKSVKKIFDVVILPITRTFFGEILYKMSEAFLYLSGKTIGYSYIRDLGLIIKHNDVVILFEDVVESSVDMQRAIYNGEIEIIKRVDASNISLDDLESLYAGDPVEIDGRVFVSKNSSRFTSPPQPRLKVGRKKTLYKKEPLKGSRKTINRNIRNTPSREDTSSVKEVEKIIERYVPQKADIDDETKNKIDNLAAVIEKLPDLLKNIENNVAEKIKDSINITVNSVTPAGPNTSSTLSEPKVEVPVILGDLKHAESNLRDASEVKEESAESLAEKAERLKKLKQAKKV